ncbi:F0F1 ATP synthase subunit delta [Sporosarcina siberiensis]|uniref:ATP synthase subunit delta n=1 Tax=Sporosarcina siberiensis TaxID=1365606 RepID=A0ABW4SJP4_9BACL
MSQSIAAKRYAQALFELAQEKGQTTSVLNDLIQMKIVYKENKELGQLLGNPKLSMARKKELLAGIFKDVNPLILNLLYVLLDRKRMDEIVNCIDEFITLANDASGIAEAKVYSTRPLTEAESASISTTFGKVVGKVSLKIENIIDPSLIGGIRLQIGNKIYDSSISGKLERLKQDLIGSQN